MPKPSLAAAWRALRPALGRLGPERVRDGLVCAALTLLAFLQSPGLIVADTKIDLALNPVGFLGRSLHLWDPAGAFGQLQNQAYGYLWPMGPFFALGTGLGLPAWVVQRLWWALLLCLAYTGAVVLARRLGIGTPAARLVAGLAFALSPRILTELGALSIEAWPSAIAPWVLIPLIRLSPRVDRGHTAVQGDQSTAPSPRSTGIRRAVAASAFAVACAGGVNATAVFAVVPLAVLWLCTLQPLRRRLLVLGAWCAAVLAATVWWLVPLLVLGRYSPPFLDYIESGSTTTGVTDPVTVLRGTSHWLAWFTDRYQAMLPAGWEIATDPLLVAATVVLAALGLAGLARRGMPHRRLLVTGLLLGFALVGLGHVGELPVTFASAQRDFLDGLGAPLRNVHKFDVLLRLPLALGLAHLVGILQRALAARRSGAGQARAAAGRARRLFPALPAVAAGVVVAVAATPAFAGVLAAPNGFTAVPGYWRDAAGWLNERADEGRVLVIPGARFPNYTWGDTLDEITQPLLTGPAGVRHAIPLSPATTIRMMDTVEAALATGYGSPALADYLARAGVSYLLVRNDLNYGRAGTPPPLLVQQALARSPGLAPVTTFGPPVQLSTSDSIDHGLGVAVPALQVLRVAREVPKVVAYPAAATATVVGGPESLLWLAEAGLLPDAPVVLAGDFRTLTWPGIGDLASAGPMLVTDGLRLRDVSFGTGRDAASATLPATEAADADDYLPTWGPQWTTSVAYDGIADVRAASSWAQANSVGGARPEHHPYAAVDGDPATSWRPARGLRSEGQWLEVTFDQPRRVPQVIVRFDQSAGGLPSRITVDTGAERVTLDTTGATVAVPLRGTNLVRSVRLTIDRAPSAQFSGSPYGVAELQIPGVTAGRTLLVPAPRDDRVPATVVLTAAGATPACFFGPVLPSAVDSAGRCSPAVARGSEDGTTLDRTLTLTVPSAYQSVVWARPRAGAALDALLDGLVGAPATVQASSAAFDEPAARPGAVLDGDPTTTWWAAPDDDAPYLRFTFPSPRLVTGLRLSLTDGATGTRVAAVTVTGPSGEGTRTAVLTNGEVPFDAPLWTSELTVGLLAGAAVRSYDPYLNESDTVPVAVSEVTVLTDEPAVDAGQPLDPGRPVDLPCGSGPTVRIDGTTVTTRVVATVRDLVQRREVPAVPCTKESTPDGPGTTPVLPAGTLRVVATASELAVATRVVLVPEAPATPAVAPVTVHIDQWSATSRLVTIAPHNADVVLAVRENTNPGWVARIGGRTLAPVILDGWQQGWVVPAGLSGQVVIDFAPEAPYRAGIIGGAALLLLVALLAVLPSRRRAVSAPVVSRMGVVLPLAVGGFALVITGGLLGAAIVVAAVAVVALRWAGAYDAARGAQPSASGAQPSAGGAPPGLRRWVRRAQLWLPPALLLCGGAAWLAVEGPNRHWLPQVAGLLSVAALWLPTVVGGARRP